MSKTKFNGFEKYFIQTALNYAIEQAEQDVNSTNAKVKDLYMQLVTLLW